MSEARSVIEGLPPGTDFLAHLEESMPNDFGHPEGKRQALRALCLLEMLDVGTNERLPGQLTVHQLKKVLRRTDGAVLQVEEDGVTLSYWEEA